MEALAASIRRAMESERPSSPGTLSAIPTARSIMTKKLICVRPEVCTRDAIAILLKHHISGMPVVNQEGKLVGMLSEADCLRTLASARFYRHGGPEHQPVGDLMSRTLTTVAPETDIYTIADRFLSAGLRRLPVVSGEELLGQVSRSDVLRGIQRMG